MKPNINSQITDSEVWATPFSWSKWSIMFTPPASVIILSSICTAITFFKRPLKATTLSATSKIHPKLHSEWHWVQFHCGQCRLAFFDNENECLEHKKRYLWLCCIAIDPFLNYPSWDWQWSATPNHWSTLLRLPKATNEVLVSSSYNIQNPLSNTGVGRAV